mgnify:CR=1 FL=1
MVPVQIQRKGYQLWTCVGAAQHLRRSGRLGERVEKLNEQVEYLKQDYYTKKLTTEVYLITK